MAAPCFVRSVVVTAGAEDEWLSAWHVDVGRAVSKVDGLSVVADAAASNKASRYRVEVRTALSSGAAHVSGLSLLLRDSTGATVHLSLRGVDAASAVASVRPFDAGGVALFEPVAERLGELVELTLRLEEKKHRRGCCAGTARWIVDTIEVRRGRIAQSFALHCELGGSDLEASASVRTAANAYDAGLHVAEDEKLPDHESGCDAAPRNRSGPEPPTALSAQPSGPPPEIKIDSGLSSAGSEGRVAPDGRPADSRTRQVLLDALVEAGIAEDPDSPRWRKMTAEELAEVLAFARLRDRAGGDGTERRQNGQVAMAYIVMACSSIRAAKRPSETYLYRP